LRVSYIDGKNQTINLVTKKIKQFFRKKLASSPL
jgi:hypothetical protein